MRKAERVECTLALQQRKPVVSLPILRIRILEVVLLAGLLTTRNGLANC
jgi:hypothetical protein